MQAEGVSRKPLDIVILIAAVGMGFYHLANVYYVFQGEAEHKITHLALALSVVYLVSLKTDRRRWLTVLLILTSLACTVYARVLLDDLLWRRGQPSGADVVVGLLVIAVVFEACRRSFGKVLPVVGLILLLYGFFGHNLPGILGHPQLPIGRIVTVVALSFQGYDIFGDILGISANVIFLLILFSGFLQAFGATDFFLEMGKLVGGRLRSGPAQTAVVSSALMGTISGQATPNIVVTGAFTIPLMKRVGYRPAIAGAIEAAASGGGQIMPPIMSAGAFVMAEFLGVPYAKVIAMAIIPALLYFYAVGVFVHFQANKLGVEPFRQSVDWRRLTETAPLFVIPLGTIIYFLFAGHSPMFAAFWGIVTLFVMALVRKQTRPSLGRILGGFVGGATVGGRIAVACATLAPLISLSTVTGIGLKIAGGVEVWSHGNMFLGLVIMMVVVIILGLEMPTVAAYVIGAIVAIPALVRMGVPLYPAHFFAFYYASFSGLTPPVGMAAVVASKLADAPYVRTAVYAVNAAMAAYLLPFIFVLNPGLLLEGASLLSVLAAIVATAAGLTLFQAGTVGYLLVGLGTAERLMGVGAGLGFLGFAAVQSYPALLAAVFLSILLLMRQLPKRRAALKDPSGSG